MKICPYCESELSDTARKCKFCWEWVNARLPKGDKYLSNEKFIEILWKWPVEINKIEYITDEQVDILFNSPFFNQGSLELNWLKEITDKQAECFSSYKWHLRLSLLSLKKITNKQLELFTKFWGDYLCFQINDNKIELEVVMFDSWNEIWCYVDLCTTIYWLSWIEDEQLNILINSGGIVNIKTNQITDSQTMIISLFWWTCISLEWTSITNKQAEILSKFAWERLKISWNISEEQKTIITKYNLYINNDEQGINDYIFDKRIDDNNYIDWENIVGVESCNNNSETLRLFFFDTETTWKDPHVEQIIQFWWIYWVYNKNTWKFEEKDRINQLVRPTKKIPEEASKVHWLYNKDLEWYGLIGEYIYEFLSFIKKADFVVWHNIEYDKTILIAETKRLNIPFDFSKVKWVDTMKPCTSLVQIPAPERSNDKYKWPKLIELHKFLFGKEFEDAHDAMADITATKDCFVELCNKYDFYGNWKFREKIERSDKSHTKNIIQSEESSSKSIDEVHQMFNEVQNFTQRVWKDSYVHPDDKDRFFDEIDINDENLRIEFMRNRKDFLEDWKHEIKLIKIKNKLFKSFDVKNINWERYYNIDYKYYPIEEVSISVGEWIINEEVWLKYYKNCYVPYDDRPWYCVVPNVYYTPYGKFKVLIDDKLYYPEKAVISYNYTSSPRNSSHKRTHWLDKDSPLFLLSDIKEIDGISYIKYDIEKIDNEYYYKSYNSHYGFDCYYSLNKIKVKNYTDEDFLFHIDVETDKPSKVLYNDGEIYDISELVEVEGMYWKNFVLKKDVSLEKDWKYYDEWGIFKLKREEAEKKDDIWCLILAIIWIIVMIILFFNSDFYK